MAIDHVAMTSSTATLDDVCEFIVDCLHATAPTEDTGYPLIRTPNIGRGRLVLQGVHRVSEDTYKRWTHRAVPRPGDLILAREAPAGNVGIIRKGQEVCLGQRTVHLRPNLSKVDADFLCYFLLAPKQQGALLATETGVTSRHVNMRDIRRLPLRELPPLVVQRRIGKAVSAYDDLIENNRRRIRLLEQSARLLYQEWFVRFRFPGHQSAAVVDGVPEGWKRKKIGEVCPFRYGKALKKGVRIPGPYPVYGSSGIVGSHEKALVAGPVIVVGRKGNVGSVFWSEGDCHPIDTVYYIDSGHSTAYIYYALLHIPLINTDAAVPGLNRDLAHSREVLLPDVRTCSCFEEHARVIHSQVHQLTSQNATLQRARDLLLPRLMTGEITV